MVYMSRGGLNVHQYDPLIILEKLKHDIPPEPSSDQISPYNTYVSLHGTLLSVIPWNPGRDHNFSWLLG